MENTSNLKQGGKRISRNGMSNSRIYRIWRNMNFRCYYPKCYSYESYGGRGINVCDEWKNDFQSFYSWSMANGYDDSLSIDRIDSNKGYSPENCRWATAKEQANNTKRNHLLTYNGKTRTLAQWSEETGVPYQTLRKRLDILCWDIGKALTTPVRTIGG